MLTNGEQIELTTQSLPQSLNNQLKQMLLLLLDDNKMSLQNLLLLELKNKQKQYHLNNKKCQRVVVHIYLQYRPQLLEFLNVLQLGEQSNCLPYFPAKPYVKVSLHTAPKKL
eukprot:TRINITY_DN1807_c0_g1_i1.p17 TRINITY_DN1807_c0_g1~~TRINITY_DN1807_c0_g1_i1.p17  ORF type:complete len:112 (+),score=3.99 TRINITY_DN1807_c0_g1_i1:1168-1503(+)